MMDLDLDLLVPIEHPRESASFFMHEVRGVVELPMNSRSLFGAEPRLLRVMVVSTLSALTV